MKKEEIEHLLVELASGEISRQDKLKLEELCGQDPVLKQETEEILLVWDAMDKAEEKADTSVAMDADFYNMLDAEKSITAAEGRRIIRSRSKVIRALIVSAACVAAFVIGRFSLKPEILTQYRTVYVKLPAGTRLARPEGAVPIGVGDSSNITKAKKGRINLGASAGVSELNAELKQKLRSVYASERLGAIGELSKHRTLDQGSLAILGLALKEDSNPNVRMMIVSVLQPLANQDSVQGILIEALNLQNDPSIQTSIIDVLVDVKSQRAIPQMISLLKNRSTELIVQERIKDGIEKFLY